MKNVVIIQKLWYTSYREAKGMAVYEYKTRIRYNDVNEDNRLSNKGLLNILSEAAGAHSDEVGYSSNTMESTNCAWMLLYW